MIPEMTDEQRALWADEYASPWFRRGELLADGTLEITRTNGTRRRYDRQARPVPTATPRLGETPWFAQQRAALEAEISAAIIAGDYYAERGAMIELADIYREREDNDR